MGSCAASIVPNQGAPVCGVAFSSLDEHLLAAACADANAYIFDVRQSSQPLHVRPPFLACSSEHLYLKGQLQGGDNAQLLLCIFMCCSPNRDRLPSQSLYARLIPIAPALPCLCSWCLLLSERICGKLPHHLGMQTCSRLTFSLATSKSIQWKLFMDQAAYPSECFYAGTTSFLTLHCPATGVARTHQCCVFRAVPAPPGRHSLHRLHPRLVGSGRQRTNPPPTQTLIAASASA